MGGRKGMLCLHGWETRTGCRRGQLAVWTVWTLFKSREAIRLPNTSGIFHVIYRPLRNICRQWCSAWWGVGWRCGRGSTAVWRCGGSLRRLKLYRLKCARNSGFVLFTTCTTFRQVVITLLPCGLSRAGGGRGRGIIYGPFLDRLFRCLRILRHYNACIIRAYSMTL